MALIGRCSNDGGKVPAPISFSWLISHCLTAAVAGGVAKARRGDGDLRVSGLRGSGDTVLALDASDDGVRGLDPAVLDPTTCNVLDPAACATLESTICAVLDHVAGGSVLDPVAVSVLDPAASVMLATRRDVVPLSSE